MIPRGHGCTLSRDLVLARRRAELRRSAAEDRDRQSAAEICISGTSSREQQTSRREKAIPLSHQIISIYDISTICRLSELQAATELGAEDAHAWVKCADPYALRCFARERQTVCRTASERAGPRIFRLREKHFDFYTGTRSRIQMIFERFPTVDESGFSHRHPPDQAGWLRIQSVGPIVEVPR